MHHAAQGTALERLYVRLQILCQPAHERNAPRGALRAEDLKKLGVVLKRAQYFLTCSGRSTAALRLSLEGVRRNLTATERASLPAGPLDQLSLFEPA